MFNKVAELGAFFHIVMSDNKKKIKNFKEEKKFKSRKINSIFLTKITL